MTAWLMVNLCLLVISPDVPGWFAWLRGVLFVVATWVSTRWVDRRMRSGDLRAVSVAVAAACLLIAEAASVVLGVEGWGPVDGARETVRSSVCEAVATGC